MVTQVEIESLDKSQFSGGSIEQAPQDEIDFENEEDPLQWKPLRRWVYVALLSWMAFVMTLGDIGFTPSLASVLSDFNISASDPISSFAVSIYGLGSLAGNFFGPQLSEVYGRLPVLHTSNGTFIVFAIACALSPNMGALVAFRFIHGIAAAVIWTLGPAMVGDLFIQEKRGLGMSIYSAGQLIGPVAGPVFDGYLVQAKGWRWIFWLITILSGADFIPAVFFMKECYGPVILSRKAEKLRRVTGIMSLRSKYEKPTLKSSREELLKAIVRPTKMFFLIPMVTIMSLYLALVYGYIWIIFTRMNIMYGTVYGFSQGAVGLTYLGLGIGTILGLLLYSCFSDWHLVRKAAGGEKKPEYRLPLMVVGALFLPSGFLVYGWAAEFRVHWVVPLFGTGLVGFGLTLSLLVARTYLVDSFPIYAASANAVVEILQALSGSLFPLAGPPIFDHLGLGWGSSLLALTILPFVPLPWFLLRYGERIRKGRSSQVKL